MKTRLLLAAALLATLTGCFDPIVGVRCADGYVPCHGRCVASCAADGAQGADAAVDGADRDQRPGDAGVPMADAGSPSPDTARGDVASQDAGPRVDVSATDALPSDGGISAPSDAPVPAPDGGAIADAATSADAAVTDAAVADAAVTNDAATAEAAPTPDAAPPIDCGALTLCAGACTDLDTDPDNCGACGASCITGLCLGGVCQQRQAGHLVVIGHDYAVSRTAMDNVVGNAVFLAPGTAVNVLAYQGDATAEEISGTDGAISRVAAGTGRTWRKVVAAAADVPAQLAAVDVFVIYAQAGASDATLTMLGQSWAAAMSSFVQSGKTIVVLEGSYANGGTFQIVQQANLFHATGRFDATDETMVVVRPGDAVATRVPETYRGQRSTVWFATTDDTVVVQVATDAGAEPVVIHLVF